MTTMLILTSLTLIAILIVLKRLRTTPQKNLSSDVIDTNNNKNHLSSTEPDGNEQASALLSKNCYVTLTQNDDEQNERSPNNNCESNALTKSMTNSCQSDQQNQILNNN